MNTNIKKLGLLALAFVASFALFACSSQSSTDESKASSSSSEAKEVKIETANGPVTVPINPKKVVTFDLGAADTIRALGHEDSIVGMPTETLPAYLADFKDKVETVGNMQEPDLNAIEAMEPDLIIASPRTAELMPQLEEIAPTILFEVDQKDYWQSTKDNIKALASIYGQKASEEADKQLKDLQSQADSISKANASSEKKALTMMLNEGNMALFGAKSRFAFIYEVLGFKPTDTEISDDRHGQEVSFEGVSEIDPDILFVVNRTLAIGGDNSSNDSLLDNQLIQETKAAKDGKIVELTSDLWYLSGGGLESIQLMIDDVKGIVDTE